MDARSFALAACPLAGAYTAIRGKLTPLALLPLVLVGLESIASMGRAAILTAGVLFLVGLLFSPRSRIVYRHWRRWFMALCVIILGASIVISFARKPTRFGLEAPEPRPAEAFEDLYVNP